MKEKKGISLIVLVVTIIVMIIIAGAIILSLTETNVIDQAEVAVEKHNDSEIQSAASMAYANWLLEEKTGKNPGNVQDYIRRTLVAQGTFTWQELSEYYISKTGVVEKINPEEFIFVIDTSKVNAPNKEMMFNFNETDATIDWGDGTGVRELYGSEQHTYAREGIYEVKIKGNIGYFEPTGNTCYYITEIKSWGTTSVENIVANSMYYLDYIAMPNENSFKNLTFFDLAFCNVEEIPDYFFKDCKLLEYVFFSGCPNLKYVSENIFEGCDKLTTIDFTDCPKLENVPEEWQ